ncbi:uncharacterized protein TNCV_1494211 [Trichonephila clavipes]|nr:uncharacterized protein TNCV_1494211 [Trichonephila clavipes]
MESASTRYYQENTTERYRYGGAGWLVWGRIILNSRTDDLHVQSVMMTGHIYRDVILEQHVRLFRGAMGAEFLFMDDNARPHHANIVDECLQSYGLASMLTGLESIRACVGYAWPTNCSSSTPSYLSTGTSEVIVLDEWCNIPQDQIDNLILSMPRRCKACIASSGRHTPY